MKLTREQSLIRAGLRPAPLRAKVFAGVAYDCEGTRQGRELGAWLTWRGYTLRLGVMGWAEISRPYKAPATQRAHVLTADDGRGVVCDMAGRWTHIKRHGDSYCFKPLPLPDAIALARTLNRGTEPNVYDKSVSLYGAKRQEESR